MLTIEAETGKVNDTVLTVEATTGEVSGPVLTIEAIDRRGEVSE